MDRLPVPTITPQELRERLEAATRPLLLDVRTHGEAQLATLPDALLIPIDELEERLDELEAFGDREIVVYCHHGIRSLSAAQFLIDRGFDAKNLAGGIDLYARTIDPALPRY